MAPAPAIAPASWAAQYPGTSRQENLPDTASDSVTAGLMWPPEMCPIAYTAPTITSMNANEIIPSSAIEKGAFVPAAITPVAAAEPAPMKTRKPVPRNSAASFCTVVGGAAMRVAHGTPVTKPEGPGLLTSSGERRRARNMFDIAERGFRKHKRSGRAPSRGAGLRTGSAASVPRPGGPGRPVGIRGLGEAQRRKLADRERGQVGLQLRAGDGAGQHDRCPRPSQRGGHGAR